jgi:hypothetical protein
MYYVNMGSRAWITVRRSGVTATVQLKWTAGSLKFHPTMGRVETDLFAPEGDVPEGFQLECSRRCFCSHATIGRSPRESSYTGTVTPERQHTCCFRSSKEHGEKEKGVVEGAAVHDSVLSLKCLIVRSDLHHLSLYEACS